MHAFKFKAKISTFSTYWIFITTESNLHDIPVIIWFYSQCIKNKKEKSSFENLILHHGKLLHVFLDKNICTACTSTIVICPFSHYFTAPPPPNKFQIVVWLTELNQWNFSACLPGIQLLTADRI